VTNYETQEDGKPIIPPWTRKLPDGKFNIVIDNTLLYAWLKHEITPIPYLDGTDTLYQAANGVLSVEFQPRGFEKHPDVPLLVAYTHALTRGTPRQRHIGQFAGGLISDYKSRILREAPIPPTDPTYDMRVSTAWWGDTLYGETNPLLAEAIRTVQAVGPPEVDDSR